MSKVQGQRIRVTGVVQGVGFRPFVYGLAQRFALTGWVRNTSAGVDIEADGTPEALAAFTQALQSEAPPLARVETVTATPRSPNGFNSFTIADSQAVPGAYQPISPDVATCPECLRELFDPADRRYRYPFINCTHCGPRFTIIRAVPYDRPNTTMDGFPLCPECAREYHDPLNRRFHAQPVACPDCGPRLWLEAADGQPLAEPATAITAARAQLLAGRIVAVKGLGGFHLACDATNPAAVNELRRRKRRSEKPFAVMLPDLAAVERYCWLSPAERAQLQARERPIVVLRRRPDADLPAALAPGQTTLGVLLPYTPLHYLLLEPAPGFPAALVMTSGNLSEEPIVTDNAAAHEQLAGLADVFLLHDRPIHTRCDDSVVRVTSDAPIFQRRSRGYAPAPLHLPFAAPPLLATGAELKNTFCLARARHAFLSHHIGDLENYETLQAFEAGVQHFERLFHVAPEAIACDLHPDYLATRYAQARAERERRPLVEIQHHHAHIAACLADNGWTGARPVLGLAFDGTGYGEDGAIWGGECLLADYEGYQRALHLKYIPLPGGDKAVKEPWRLALAWLDQAAVEWAEDLPPVQTALAQPLSALSALRRQLRTGLNAPRTSSLGRLFDAVASLAGVRQQVNYEAQAAIELEALVDPHETGAYPIEVGSETLDPTPAILAVVADLRAGVALSVISARFHNGLARMALTACRQLRDRYQVSEVALSGGVWQNITLLEKTVALLNANAFTVLQHRHLPANDGGLAVGQIAIAAHRLAHLGG